MYMIRCPDGKQPQHYKLATTELPRVWRWRTRFAGGGVSAVGFTASDAEERLREFVANERSDAPVLC